MTPKCSLTSLLSQWNVPLPNRKSNCISLRKAKPYLHSCSMHPHILQGNLWGMTPSTVFKTKHLAEEVGIICTLPTGRTGHRQVQTAHVCDDSQISALMLRYRACSSAFPSLSLPPKITFPYLQSPLSLPYLYFICISTLIHVLFTCNLTKAFANAAKTYWDWGHSSLLCIYCAQTLHPGPELQLVLYNSLFCTHSVWFYITG